MIRTATLAALILAIGGAAACSDSPVAPISTPAFTHTDLRVGTGAEAATGRVLRVHYTGWLYDPSKADSKGQRFDTNVEGNPLEFVVGVGEVIPGWDQGLPGMRVGGQRRLVIPPSLAYGGTRNGPIPPFSALVFDVELIAVTDPDDDEN